ncbi:MAG: VOC family protein [Acidimicrobiia bacterium]|nr:VOC family protein [Acidimicrobiia bacterium]
MRITLTNVIVDDQAKALAFYTEVLGFQKYHDVPVGQYSWLAVVSPEQPDGPELLLEPAGVEFTQPPTDLGTVVSAIFDDTCGNLIQIVTPATRPA